MATRLTQGILLIRRRAIDLFLSNAMNRNAKAVRSLRFMRLIKQVARSAKPGPGGNVETWGPRALRFAG
jgi:hypothetical protein